jgi:hypothetical protein
LKPKIFYHSNQFLIMKRTIYTFIAFMILTIPTLSQGPYPITVEKKGISKRYMQNGQNLNRKELRKVLISFSGSESEYKIASRNSSIGGLLMGGGCLVIGASSLYDAIKDANALKTGSGEFSGSNAGPYLIGCGMVLAGIPFALIANSHFIQSIKIYNAQNRTGSLSNIKLNFTITPKGAGFIMHF